MRTANIALALVALIFLGAVALTPASSTTPLPSPSPSVTPTVTIAPLPSLAPFPLDPLSRRPIATPSPAPTPKPKPKPVAPKPRPVAKPKPKPVIRYALRWPIRARVRISQRYGCTGFVMEPRYGSCRHFHTGIDLVAPYGARVVAAHRGVVVQAGWVDNCGGRQVLIRYGSRYYLYAHLSRVLTARGRSVHAGTTIGRLGSSGCTTGAHLHFQVSIGWPWHSGSRFVSPWPYRWRVRVS